MSPILADAARSVLVVVDVQPSFLNGIVEAERVLARTAFLVEMASLLEIPVLATEQYPSRMGGTHATLLPLLETARAPRLGKMTFSCAGCQAFDESLAAMRRDQVVLCGIETHICVTQTALMLLGSGHEVLVAGDAVSARTEMAHDLGAARMRQAGAAIAHSESVAYEWMVAADHPRFREALSVVKRYAS
ncbi:MAG: isochorismatase family protein [Fimbriimonadaceae bacterium]|nr:isochorismatase family protein [Fimbriimonadaceae bacterium]